MTSEIFNYNGNNITFQLGNGDVMINATEMAKPFIKKRPNDYLNLTSTKEYISSITRNNGIEINGLINTVRGGNKSGTWMHEDIALDFAQWLSVDFKIWCNNKIKELLKHGFTATEIKLDEIVANPDLLIKLAQTLKQERAEKLKLQEQNQLQDQQLKISAPKVKYHDDVLSSVSTYTTSQIAKELGMSATALNKTLKSNKIQYKQNNTWLLYAKHQDKGYTKTKTYSYTDDFGNTKTSMQTVWTEKGRLAIHNFLKQTQNA